MEIDIESLTEEELIALNHKIVETFDFQIGQSVAFDSPDGERITGILTKYNKKTVTVITDAGQRWNISPRFLKPAEKLKASRTKR